MPLSLYLYATMIPALLHCNGLYSVIKDHNRHNKLHLTCSGVELLAAIYGADAPITLRALLSGTAYKYDYNFAYLTLQELAVHGHIECSRRGIRNYYTITAKGIALLVLVNDMTERLAAQQLKKLRKMNR